MSVFHKVNRSGKSKVLSPEERSLIQSRLPEKYRLISEVLYWSAGRIQEVLSIRVRNLVPERGMVVLERKTTKTKETREVYLPEHLMERLVSRATALGLEPSEPLFFNQSPTESGQSIRRPLSTQSFDKELRKVCDWNRYLASHPTPSVGLNSRSCIGMDGHSERSSTSLGTRVSSPFRSTWTWTRQWWSASSVNAWS